MQVFSANTDRIENTISLVNNKIETDYLDMIKKMIEEKPFGKHPFYIFTFPKRTDDLIGVKTIYHQPRLTKPDPMPGTTLIKVNPNREDEIRIIWILPGKESFNMYKKGKRFSDPIVYDSIQAYLKNPDLLTKPEPDDLTEDEIKDAYREKVKTA